MESSPAALEALQALHLEAIPFEHVDVRLGRPIDLDLEALQAKLVRRRRGGYCFEQKTLFAAMLGAFGFEVATLEARVRPLGPTAPLPRTHLLLGLDLTDREIDSLARSERPETAELDARARRDTGSSGINDRVSMVETTDRG